MRWLCLALIAGLAACSTSSTRQTSAAVSPTPSTASSPSPTPAPLPAPTAATSSIPLSRTDFACRLPIVQETQPGHYQAGMLQLPAGTFAPATDAPASPGYYDVAVSKWLPVRRGAVAPDGLHYAFMTGGSPSLTPGPPRLHVVSAASGAEKVLDPGLRADLPYGVEDYHANDAIYIGSSWEGAVAGHWRINPATGTVVDLSSVELLLDDGTGHAWRAVFDPRDPAPAHSALSGEPMPNEIVRRDLKTGLDEVWFFHPGLSLAVAGHFAGGALLVWGEPDTTTTVADPSHQYWLVTAPGKARLVVHLDYGTPTMADAHGVWMGGAGGLFLFTPDGVVRRVSDVSGEPANGCLPA